MFMNLMLSVFMMQSQLRFEFTGKNRWMLLNYHW